METKEEINKKTIPMTTAEIESLFLNIGDVFEMTCENFYYKITQESGIKFVEVEQKKEPEDEWIPCPILTGSYCGYNYKQEKENRGELNVIKIRVASPFNMGSAYRNYLTFAPSQITGITIINKKKGNVLDKIGHALTIEKQLNVN